MKISDGNWLLQPNFNIINPAEVFSYEFKDGELTFYATVQPVHADRGLQINTPIITYRISSPLEGIIKVRLVHHEGTVKRGPDNVLYTQDNVAVVFNDTEDYLEFISGSLSVRISKKQWCIDFYQDGKRITGTSYKNNGYIRDIYNEDRFMFERLDLSVGECVYGLGERFTSFVKNGQIVETWNRDGGTSTEQAYKNIPLYITNKGYGVFVNHPELVSYEVASEKVTKVQFSVAGENLEYMVIAGPTPKDALQRYIKLSGLPALPPKWSFGLWLTTSFTTNYDEATVSNILDGMAQRDIPLHVFHFDCFWMKGFEWCNFTWDEACFPDPEGMLKRYHEDRKLKICVWINPYIGQKSPLFKEGMEKGYLIKRPNGDVWQWDNWQSGLGVVDFTNPEATKWYQDKLRALVDMGVDCFKTDFGERIPTDCVYFDGSDPQRMHNFYTYLYNKAVFEVLEEKKGKGNAVLFARSAIAGGQQFPAHWGGDCYGTYESMAETLRGGLSLGMCGFGFWSHDIGGFETTAPADVYKRWVAFGLLSSHSRLHGSKSYRVPWNYDEESCDVLRFFTKLKCSLMPYLYAKAVESHQTGLPMLRAMALEFNEDRACDFIETQYMLGDKLLVAPVFSESGDVDFYLPRGTWTHLLNNEVKCGGSYEHEVHNFKSLPLYVKGNTLLALGSVDTKPDYEFNEGTRFELFALEDGKEAKCELHNDKGEVIYSLVAKRSGSNISFEGQGDCQNFSVLLRNVKASSAEKTSEHEFGTLVSPSSHKFTVSLA